jgi:2-polyprenyl-3-methyl-5-hydroxy-6-metoxy-1,4-benzoquinol methylase
MQKITIYDKNFYSKTLRPDRQESYRNISTAIVKLIHPQSVLDLGCGAGWILYYLNSMGVSDVNGIEPSPYINNIAHESVVNKIANGNLTNPISLGRKFDLVICLEVVEHFDAVYADIAVNNICNHSDLVLFSAAHPGQGGVGHVNERSFGYWLSKFTANGFILDAVLTDKFIARIKSGTIKKWYVENCRILKCAK